MCGSWCWSYQHYIYACILRKEEIEHFQSIRRLWVSRLQVITVNCWICRQGEHYNRVCPDKAVLKQTKSCPLPPSFRRPRSLIELISMQILLFNMLYFHKGSKSKSAEAFCLLMEIALGWYPSLQTYIVLEPKSGIKSNKEPQQANVITPHPRRTRLSIRTMALI